MIHNYTLGHLRLTSESNETYKTSKLGDLPSDWEVVQLKENSSLITNGFVGKATPYYTDKAEGVKYLQGMNVRRNKIDLRGLTFINEWFHNKQTKTQLKAGDILTVQSGHIGETAVVTEELEGSNCHAVIITRLDNDEFNPTFVSYFMNSLKGQVKMKGITVGTTVAHINTSELKKFLVPKPALSEQNKIVSRLKQIERAHELAKSKSSRQLNLSKALISKVF